MRGDDADRRHEKRIGCTDLAGHEHDLIVVDDRVGLVVVFPPGAWAVLASAQVEQLAALVALAGQR